MLSVHCKSTLTIGENEQIEAQTVDSYNIHKHLPYLQKNAKFGEDGNFDYDNEPNHEKAVDESRNQLKSGEILYNTVASRIKKALAPAQSYASLLNRYHRWFLRYKKLEQKRITNKTPAESIKESYAKADAKIIKRQCSKKTHCVDVSEFENFDFVFMALSSTIDELELTLEQLETNCKANDGFIDPNDSHSSIGDDVDEEEDIFFDTVSENEQSNQDDESAIFHDASDEHFPIDSDNDAQIMQAMDRVKRIAFKTAKKIMTDEFVFVAKMTALNTAATYMTNNHQLPGDPLKLLTRVVCLLGSANTPLAVDYLRNLELRAALALINRLNPFNFGMCSRLGLHNDDN